MESNTNNHSGTEAVAKIGQFKSIIREEEGISSPFIHVSMVIDRLYEMQTVWELRNKAKELLGLRTSQDVIGTTNFKLEELDSLVKNRGDFLSTIFFEETKNLPPEVKEEGLRYFNFSHHKIEGRTNYLPLKEATDPAITTEPVVIKKINGQYQICVDRTLDRAELRSRSSPEIWIVLGPDPTGTFPEIVVDWFPGRVLSFNPHSLTDWTAVKEYVS